MIFQNTLQETGVEEAVTAASGYVLPRTGGGHCHRGAWQAAVSGAHLKLLAQPGSEAHPGRLSCRPTVKGQLETTRLLPYFSGG